MNNQSQRFLSILLLFSMLLQSCHNADFRLDCEEVPKVPVSQQGANTLLATPAQQTLVPIHAVAIEKISGNPTEGSHATPVASPTIIASYHAQDVGNAAGAPTSSRTTSVKHAYTSEPSPKVQEAAQYPTYQSVHRVLDNTLLVKHTHRKEMRGTAISAPVWSSAHAVQLALPSQEGENLSQTEEKSITHHTVRQASSHAMLSSASARSYLSAQGHQVRFEEQAGGAWLAQVQDVWGRVQRLPVICAPDQTSEQAIQLLADKNPAQCKYWVHVLETNQLPGAPRFVYVGVLSIRGGGNSSSSGHGSSGRSNRESRRDRDDFSNDNQRVGVTLGTVAIGSQGAEMRFGPRNHHADSIASNSAVNEAIRSAASGTWRSSTNISTSGPSLSLHTPTFPGSRASTPAVTTPRSSLGVDTSVFTGSSSYVPTLPRSGLNINTFSIPSTPYEAMRRTSSHSTPSSSEVPRYMVDSLLRRCANDIDNSGSTSQFSGSTSTPVSTSDTRQRSTDTGTRFANRNTDRQGYSATDHQEKTQSQESENRPRQGEQQHQEENTNENEEAPQLLKEFRRGLAVLEREAQEKIAKAVSDIEHAFEEERRENEEATRKDKEELLEAINNIKHAFEESCRRQAEVSSATTGPNTQQQRSGAVVSQGFVLDGKGELKPHEVRVPFAAPRAYQAFPEAKAATAVQDTHSADTVEKTTEIQTALKQSVAAYQQSCKADIGFQQQRSAFSQLGEQLKSEASNEGLVRRYQEQEAKFQQHPLYQQGCDLAKEAQKLREAENAKADRIIINEAAMRRGVEGEKLRQIGRHRQVEAGIRDDLLQPVREILKRSSTPPGFQSAGRFAQGVGESAVSTTKGIISLPVVVAKFLGGAVHSLVTREDKLGIGEKITDATELVKAFCEDKKYEWENPEEYQARFQAAQRCRNELNIAEKALNAEAYHKKEAQTIGYWSSEALLAAFGAEIIKGGTGLVKGMEKAAEVSQKVAQSDEAAKAAKASQKVAQGGKAAQAAKASKKAAQGTEATQGVVKAAESIEKGAGTTSAVQRAEKEAAQQAGAVARVAKGSKVEGVERGVESVANTISLQEIKISQEGICGIRKHLATMDADRANEIMIKRLENIASGKARPTDIDLNFYAHELREMELMKQGIGYSEAHKRALREYGVEYKRGYGSQLYTQEAIEAGDKWYKELAGVKK